MRSRSLKAKMLSKKVTGPTEWVSRIVTPPKPKSPDEIRLCVDMREANKAIMRTRRVTPTLDELITDLHGASVFSKIYILAGYHQLVLHSSCRHITTFSTHLGLYQYNRLSFGVNSAAEVFQHTVQTALDGTKGVRNISERLSEKLSFGIISAAEVFQYTVQTALDGTKGERNISERLSEKLSFGIISAAEVFQHTVQTALGGTKSVRNISERLSFGINSAAEVFKHTT